MVCPDSFGKAITVYAEMINLKINSVQISTYFNSLKHLPHIVKVINKCMTDKTYFNGSMLRLPTISELKEYYNQLDGVFFGNDDNNQYKLEGPKKPSIQRTADLQLMIYLVHHFKCCEDKVMALIDSGKLKADKKIVSGDIFNNIWSKDDRAMLKRKYFELQYKDVINTCQRG
jgi:hypothetical protein